MLRCFAITVLIAIVLADWAAAGQNSFHDARAEAIDSFCKQSSKLARQADEQGQTDVANAIRVWILPYARQGTVLFTVAQIRNDTADGQIAESDVWTHFQSLRDTFAEKLFSLGRSAVSEGQLAMAVRLATEAVRANPKHETAWNALGYAQTGGRWQSNFEARMHERGMVWHPQFGWLAEDDVPRYEAGSRRLGNRWISSEDDARRHVNIARGWVVRSEHFQVTTNHSLEEAAQLADRLESLYAIWIQLFGDFALKQSVVKARFQGVVASRTQARPFRVTCFATRDEYNRALVTVQPKIAMTLGIYFDDRRRAYFFAGEEQHPATVHHEAAHQLFSEAQPSARNIGRLDNFWIIEGAATYFESLEEYANCYVIGAPDGGRLEAARQRRLVDDYYVPLAELVLLGKDDLQQRADIGPLYSQMAGLTAFFMNGNQASYRSALVQYLKAVYKNRADEQSLAQLTDRSYPQLDAEYRMYLERIPHSRAEESDRTDSDE